MFSKRFKQIYKSTKEFFLLEIYYRVTDYFNGLFYNLKKSWAHARFGYKVYDFDGLYTYSYMSFYLKRLKNVLVNGIAVQYPEDMKALDEAVEICDRLGSDDYEDKYLDVLLKNKNIEERQNIYKQIEKERYDDIDRLAEIFKKHLPTWWE